MTVQRNNTTFIHRPIPIRLLNGFGKLLNRFGKTAVSLSAESLMAAAQKQTQLSDFGNSSFRPALEKLLLSFNEESRLTLMGQVMVREFCTGLLSNRLLVADTIKRLPAITQQPISRPIFVIGLPRTGTTLLHRLLSQHPSARFLYTWETFRLGEPPDPKTHQEDPRIKQIAQRMKFVDYLAPELQHKHPVGPLLPEECIALMCQTFITPLMFSVMADVPGYTRWLDKQDLTPAYRTFKQLLQILQFKFPPVHWVLKSPGHLLQLESLLEVFPDACIVQTHRHPQKVIPSWCSLIATMHGMATDEVDPLAIGEFWSNRWAQLVERTLEVRKTAVTDQFFDVNYHDLIANPIQTVHDIYAHFNFPLNTEMEQNMKSWHQGNRQHKHGIHRYSAEQFGLKATKIEEQFAAYLTAHPLPLK